MKETSHYEILLCLLLLVNSTHANPSIPLPDTELKHTGNCLSIRREMAKFPQTIDETGLTLLVKWKGQGKSCIAELHRF